MERFAGMVQLTTPYYGFGGSRVESLATMGLADEWIRLYCMIQIAISCYGFDGSMDCHLSGTIKKIGKGILSTML